MCSFKEAVLDAVSMVIDRAEAKRLVVDTITVYVDDAEDEEKGNIGKRVAHVRLSIDQREFADSVEFVEL